jgi:hypothetical protein
MGDDSTNQFFRAMQEKHFLGLCRKLGLSDETLICDSKFAVASAAAGNVRVFFEHERGLCIFGLGAARDAKALCSVDELAERFPRIRLMTEGHQRLSLEEQHSFVESHWSDLQVMFSPQHIGETRKWREAAAAELMRGYSGES